jgi:putative membrane-bound dehydrogenase-like protein
MPSRRWPFALALLAAAVAVAPAQVPPDKALATMTAGAGLQVELFAAEPMLVNPTSIDVDDVGRVWVAEAVNYRRVNFNRPLLRKEGDRIVVLTDTDGDGKADTSTVFYQGKELYGPLSVLAIPQVKDGKKAGYRVLVAQSPDILEFADADGDLKADGPPKKFLTGFLGFDHDHGVHGLHMGPDGKLYFTVGDQGVKNLQSADGKGRKFSSNNTDIQGGTVWRCDMDGKNLELIAHNFRNNYEAAVDSFGEIWCSDNDDDGNQQTRICFVMPGGNYGYFPRGAGQTHWHEEQPGIVQKTLRTGFGSPTGMQIYEGQLLPKQYHDTILHTDAGPRELRAFTRKPKGAGYELDKTLMLTSTDSWFRPSDVCVAPDGSVFVADWYDPGVGGHGMGDHTRGRIYRVTPAGHKGYAVPKLNLSSPEGLAAATTSPNLDSRAAAHAYLAGLADDKWRVAMNGLVTKAVDEKQMGRIMWTARQRSSRWFPDSPPAQAPELTAAGQAALLRFFDVFATRDGGTVASMLQNYGEPSQAEDLKSAPSAYRRELLTLMRKLAPADQAKAAFYALAKLYDGNDIFYRAALNIALGTDPARRDAILADFATQFPEWNDTVADLVWELRPKSMLPKMGELLTSDKLTVTQKGRIVDILAASPELAAGKSVLALVTSDQPAAVKTRAIENLRLFLPTKWAGLTKSGELGSAVTKLLGHADTRLTGLQLVAAAKYAPALKEVVAIAEDQSLTPPTRVEAVRTLGQLPTKASAAALVDVALPDNPLTADAVKALGHMLDRGVPADAGKLALDTLTAMTADPMASPASSAAALEVLAGSRIGTQWLLDAQKQGKLPKNLVASTGRLLRNSPFQGERNKAMILFPAPGKINPKAMPSPAELATRKGNADLGKAILAKSLAGESQCLKCHTVRGQGGQIGPDLSMIGKKGSRENLYESVLNPSKAVADQYVTWKVDTLDGQSISGLIVGETETTLTLRDANGKDYSVPVKDIDQRAKSLVSIMPEGLAATLTEDELVDLVEYLTTLQTPSLTPDSWQVAGPFKADSMAAALARDDKPKDWRVEFPRGSYFDLAALYGERGVNSASYFKKEIESPVAQDAMVLVGTDDGAILWVNGVEVLRHADAQAASPEKYKVPVKLKAGTNTVLLKVANGSNPHGFYFAITSAQELKAK